MQKFLMDRIFWIILNLELSFIFICLFAYKTWDFFIDDSYIGFRYIKNFLNHGQFTYNLNENVEGVSNIGWLLFNLPFCYILPITLTAKLLGILFVFLTIIILKFYLDHFYLSDSAPYIYIILLLIATNYDYIYFSISGLETSFLSFFLVLFILLLSQKPFSFWPTLIGAFLFTVHPECILIYPICLFIYAINENRVKTLYYLFYFFSLIFVFTIIRISYFNSLLPNTFYAKSINSNHIIDFLFSYGLFLKSNIPPPFESVFSLLICLYGIIELLKHHYNFGVGVGVTLVVGIIFSLYAPIDWTNLGRYIAPYIPLIYLSLITGLCDLFNKLKSSSYFSFNLCLSFLVLIFLYLFLFNCFRMLILSSDKFTQSYPGYVLTSSNLIKPSIWINEHINKNSIIATRRIGTLGFYTDLYVFDYKFGLTDKQIAQLVYKHKCYFDNPADVYIKEIWINKCPDYILEEEKFIDIVLLKIEDTKQSFLVHNIEYISIHEFDIGNDSKWILLKKKEPKK